MSINKNEPIKHLYKSLDKLGVKDEFIIYKTNDYVFSKDASIILNFVNYRL